MSLRHFALLTGCVALAIALGGATPTSQSRVQIAPNVTARITNGEAVRVIIGVDATFVPEGQLDGMLAIGAQRAAMRASVNAVRAEAAAAGVTLEPAFEFIPYFPATVTRASFEQLRKTPGIVSIQEVTTEAPSTYVSVPATNTPAAVAAGFNGSGWAVAVLDSGSDYTHSMLAGSVLSEACYSSSGASLCPGGVAQTTASGSGQACSSSIDGCDHGTHVASIAVGSEGNSFGPGMAPGAWLVPMQVFNYSSQAGGIVTNSVDYTRALERVLALAGPGNANQFAAVNMSLGGGQVASQAQCDVDNAAVKAAIDNLRSIGIATIVASGNNGYTNAISRPACISSAVSVGSTSKFAPDHGLELQQRSAVPVAAGPRRGDRRRQPLRPLRREVGHLDGGAARGRGLGDPEAGGAERLGVVGAGRPARHRHGDRRHPHRPPVPVHQRQRRPGGPGRRHLLHARRTSELLGDGERQHGLALVVGGVGKRGHQLHRAREGRGRRADRADGADGLGRRRSRRPYRTASIT